MNIPRRICVEFMTTEEKELLEMVGKIEILGAHSLLTDVVILLGDARQKLADWVDQQKVNDVCGVCEKTHDLVILKKGDGFTDYFCDVEKETFTRIIRYVTE